VGASADLACPDALASSPRHGGARALATRTSGRTDVQASDTTPRRWSTERSTGAQRAFGYNDSHRAVPAPEIHRLKGRRCAYKRLLLHPPGKPSASEETIDAAYARLSKAYDPRSARSARRRSGGRLQEAYEVLSDRKRRAEYAACIRGWRPGQPVKEETVRRAFSPARQSIRFGGSSPRV